MQQSAWAVTVTFEVNGTTITRPLPAIRDTFKSSAIARAIRNGIPANAIVRDATARRVG